MNNSDFFSSLSRVDLDVDSLSASEAGAWSQELYAAFGAEYAPGQFEDWCDLITHHEERERERLEARRRTYRVADLY